MYRHLYRPKRNRVITGVCSGFAEYFGIDAVIVRIITIVIAFSGMGILAYIVASIIMPDESSLDRENQGWSSEADSSNYDFAREQERQRSEWAEPPKYNSEKNKMIIGTLLVGLGVVFLIKQFIPSLESRVLIPLVLIGVGGLIIFKGRR